MAGDSESYLSLLEDNHWVMIKSVLFKLCSVALLKKVLSVLNANQTFVSGLV